jgi:hypothetical protein
MQRKKILNVGHSAPTTSVNSENVTPIQPDGPLSDAGALERSLSRNLPTLMNRVRKWMTTLYYGLPPIATYYSEPSTDGADAGVGHGSNSVVSDGVDNASTKAALSALLADVPSPHGERLRLRYVKNRRRASGGK